MLFRLAVGLMALTVTLPSYFCLCQVLIKLAQSYLACVCLHVDSHSSSLKQTGQRSVFAIRGPLIIVSHQGIITGGAEDVSGGVNGGHCKASSGHLSSNAANAVCANDSLKDLSYKH